MVEQIFLFAFRFEALIGTRPDAVKVMEDNTDARPIAVHKTIGKGHVVLLGLDMYSVDANQDMLLKNIDF